MNTHRAARSAILALCGLVILTCSVAPTTAADWPQWRGPNRSGHTDETDLPLTWDGKTKENILWKVQSDFGHSTPIVLGDRVILSGSVRKMPKDPENIAAKQTHRVTCYKTADG